MRTTKLPDKQITLNKEIAKIHMMFYTNLEDEFGLKDDITVSNVASAKSGHFPQPKELKKMRRYCGIRLKPFLTAHLATRSQCVSVRVRGIQ